MSAAIWVYLSTIVFIVLVYYLSKVTILSSLSKKQKDIADTLTQVKLDRSEAEALYDKFRQKMDALEAETDDIIKNAEETATQILSQAENEIEAFKKQKTFEIQRKIKEYEQAENNKRYEKYADLIVSNISSRERKNIKTANIDFSNLSA